LRPTQADVVDIDHSVRQACPDRNVPLDVWTGISAIGVVHNHPDKLLSLELGRGDHEPIDWSDW
jgi:hypothetical protein